MKKMILFYIAISAITIQLCFAQSEAGHGGNAVFKNGKYYLMDLVEAHIEETGKIDSTIHDCPRFFSTWDYGVKGSCLWYGDFFSSKSLYSTLGWDVIIAVLNAATRLPNYEGLALMKAIELFNWNVIPLPLKKLDDNHTPIDLKDYPVYPLATRKDHTITINKIIWDQMDLLNKAALVTHEVLYAMVKPIPDLVHSGFLMQDSYYARQFNATLYQEFRSPRMREEMINDDYTFALYSASFGNYGEADDFIGRDVVDQGSLRDKGFIATPAYIKLEGAVQTNLVPGAPPESVAREKWKFFKNDADEICRTVFFNSGSYTVKASLVRTLFTMKLSTYPSSGGHSRFVQVEPSEMPLSKWYQGKIGSVKDQIEIINADQESCVQQLQKAATEFESIMRSTYDFNEIWLTH